MTFKNYDISIKIYKAFIAKLKTDKFFYLEFEDENIHFYPVNKEHTTEIKAEKWNKYVINQAEPEVFTLTPEYIQQYLLRNLTVDHLIKLLP